MTATKVCKVCGKEYEYCHTFRRDTVFRWQDVACCVDHGSQYFERIAAVRNKAKETKVEVEEVVSEVLDSISDMEVNEVSVVEESASSKKSKKK